MRYIFGALFFISIGWAGYWFIGSSAQQNAVKNWLDSQAQSGWVANYSEVAVKGFPNRFDTKVSALEIADPNYGWAISLPEFNIMQLSYQPNHVIVQFPQTGRIATPFGTVDVASDNIKASVVFEANTDLAINRSTITLKDIRMTSSKGWETKIKDAVLASKQSDKTPFGHDIAFDANEFTPSIALKEQLDPSGALPSQFDTLSLRTSLHFDAPWDLPAIEGDKPILTHIDLDDFDAAWGQLNLQAKGAVDVDRLGYPTGKVSLRAKNWREMLNVAVASGAITKDLKSTIEGGLRLIAGLSGNKNTLDVNLSFKNKLTFIGPIPVGPAPILIVR
jgi:hypothetical protein